MLRRIVVLFVLGLVGVLVAQPAYAQYHAQGPFTATPVNMLAGQTTQVQGYCEVGDTVTVTLDGTVTVVGTGVVPGGPSTAPPPLVTAQVTVTATIPSSAHVGNHTLTVTCSGGHAAYQQVININVLSPVCVTSGSPPPPLGGVYGIYGGDPQGGAPPARVPGPNTAFQGTVTKAAGGAPIPNASVQLEKSTGQAVGSMTNTDVNGNYSFPNTSVTVGVQYKVQFAELGFVTAVSGLNTYSGSAVTVNQSLTAAPSSTGAVSGVVTDSVTSQPLQAVSVRIWEVGTIGRYLATATNSTGHYSFIGIPSGTYQLQFAAAGYSTYWYNGATARGSATAFTVGSTPQPINAVMSGLCTSNSSASVKAASFTSHGLPITLTTGGVVLLIVASSALLFDSKRKVALAHRSHDDGATGAGPDPAAGRWSMSRFSRK